MEKEEESAMRRGRERGEKIEEKEKKWKEEEKRRTKVMGEENRKRKKKKNGREEEIEHLRYFKETDFVFFACSLRFRNRRRLWLIVLHNSIISFKKKYNTLLKLKSFFLSLVLPSSSSVEGAAGLNVPNAGNEKAGAAEVDGAAALLIAAEEKKKKKEEQKIQI